MAWYILSAYLSLGILVTAIGIANQPETISKMEDITEKDLGNRWILIPLLLIFGSVLTIPSVLLDAMFSDDDDDEE